MKSKTSVAKLMKNNELRNKALVMGFVAKLVILE